MQRRVRIAASVGLHARPAALLAQAAAAQTHPVTIAKVVDGEAGAPVDAASVLGLMSLGAQHGEEVELSGPDEAALAELAALLEQDLDKTPA
ncbi:HPr family phosphocarrier protein [Saccharopolyspora hirsuta]|uniref:Phosphocarrier protein HPr n=1 Tax=Saccharopolyspora hirsuta TaxID=1837 RepID=A0A5M7BV99_SACHI|nr:HPr family phosphocarrier protein [Saccharopolyspora hirsuta]KAA5832058.1 HPr family phosphocarrier protein [Saccharopolyspora hirsuta]